MRPPQIRTGMWPRTTPPKVQSKTQVNYTGDLVQLKRKSITAYVPVEYLDKPLSLKRALHRLAEAI